MGAGATVLQTIGEAIGAAICEPKLRLGRRRHDNHCDECGRPCEEYALERLAFPLADLSPDATTTREKLRAMVRADYERYCLECGHEIETDGGGLA